MPITFDCPCGKTLRVPDAHVNKRAKCPACNAILIVPEILPVAEVVEAIPPLPPDPSVGVEPVVEPELGQVALPPLDGKPYGKPRFDDDDGDKTPYGVAGGQGEKSRDLDSDGKPRRKDGLPNFNKGGRKYKN